MIDHEGTLCNIFAAALCVDYGLQIFIACGILVDSHPKRKVHFGGACAVTHQEHTFRPDFTFLRCV